jgi:hypothetical protein
MMVQQLMGQRDLIHDQRYFWMFAQGRLKPGVAPQQAAVGYFEFSHRQIYSPALEVVFFKPRRFQRCQQLSGFRLAVSGNEELARRKNDRAKR